MDCFVNVNAGVGRGNETSFELGGGEINAFVQYARRSFTLPAVSNCSVMVSLRYLKSGNEVVWSCCARVTAF
jgi:hypothetical protein